MVLSFGFNSLESVFQVKDERDLLPVRPAKQPLFSDLRPTHYGKILFHRLIGPPTGPAPFLDVLEAVLLEPQHRVVFRPSWVGIIPRVISQLLG